MVNLAPHLVQPAAAAHPRVRGQARRPARGRGAEHVRRDGHASACAGGAGDDEEWSPERHRTIDAEETMELLPALAAREPDLGLPLLRLPDRRRAPGAHRARRGRALRRGVLQRRGGVGPGGARRPRRRRALPRRRGRRRVRADAPPTWSTPPACGPTASAPTSCTTRPRCRRISPSRGTHVTVSKDDLPVVAGAIVPAGSGRSIFVLPWLGPHADRHDRQRLRGLARPRAAGRGRHRLPAGRPRTSSSARRWALADLTGAYAGVRPLISTGDPKKSVDISRKAELYETSSGHGHDHRRQAHHLAADGEDGRGPDRRARGPRGALPHPRDPARHAGRAGASWRPSAGVDEESRDHLAGRYGHAAVDVLELAAESSPSWPARSSPDLPDLVAEAAVRRPPRAGALAGRRDAAPHPPRAARRPPPGRRRGSEGAGGDGAGDGAGAGLGRRRDGARRSTSGTRWQRRGAGARGAGAVRRPSAHEAPAARAGARARAGRRALMGIVNATPDSFSDRQGAKDLDELVERGLRAGDATGAAIVDVGGESGRTDREAVSEDEEAARVVPRGRAARGRGRRPCRWTPGAPGPRAAALGAGRRDGERRERPGRPGAGRAVRRARRRRW